MTTAKLDSIQADCKKMQGAVLAFHTAYRGGKRTNVSLQRLKRVNQLIELGGEQQINGNRV